MFWKIYFMVMVFLNIFGFGVICAKNGKVKVTPMGSFISVLLELPMLYFAFKYLF